jgi:hypothetical protein
LCHLPVTEGESIDRLWLLSGDLLRDSVIANSNELRVAETAILSPFKEFDRRHQLRLESAASLHVFGGQPLAPYALSRFGWITLDCFAHPTTAPNQLWQTDFTLPAPNVAHRSDLPRPSKSVSSSPSISAIARYFADLGESLQRWTVCWMRQSNANYSLSTCQPVGHTAVDKRRLTRGG